MNEAAKTAPAAARNREPILQVLRDILPPSALVLEIASGTGEHAVWFSKALPTLTWQPTDQDAEALNSIAAWRDVTGLANVLPPLHLDAASQTWPVDQADVVIAINMVHIAPWDATLGLIAGAARVLSPGGLLILYGPFREGGKHTGDGNAAFDADLRARDPAWGIRDLDELAACACPARICRAAADRHAGKQPECGVPPDLKSGGLRHDRSACSTFALQDRGRLGSGGSVALTTVAVIRPRHPWHDADRPA